mgnify:CR=1 FL=1
MSDPYTGLLLETASDLAGRRGYVPIHVVSGSTVDREDLSEGYEYVVLVYDEKTNKVLSYFQV